MIEIIVKQWHYPYGKTKLTKEVSLRYHDIDGGGTEDWETIFYDLLGSLGFHTDTINKFFGVEEDETDNNNNR